MNRLSRFSVLLLASALLQAGPAGAADLTANGYINTPDDGETIYLKGWPAIGVIAEGYILFTITEGQPDETISGVTFGGRLANGGSSGTALFTGPVAVTLNNMGEWSGVSETFITPSDGDLGPGSYTAQIFWSFTAPGLTSDISDHTHNYTVAAGGDPPPGCG